jgi:Serine dehydrogenase proteinase
MNGLKLRAFMARAERINLIRQIEAMRGSRVICCLTSDRQATAAGVPAAGVIAKDFIPIFFEHLSAFQDCKSVDVFMFTQGGDTLAAFGLSCLVREFAPSFGVLVPHWCHSAGTLFALGANEIVMTKVATLTPIDPSVQGPLGPVVELAPGQRQLLPVSVESVAGYKSLIREDWKLSEEGAALAFKILAEKINPLALGDVYRSRQQIGRLARTLLGYHRQDKENIENVVIQLTGGLGSHDYLISRSEARKLFTSQVGKDDKAIEDLIWSLYLDFKNDMSLGQIFDAGMVVSAWIGAGKQPPAIAEQKVVVVESSTGGDEFERVFRLSQVQAMTPAGPAQVLQPALVRAGWKHYN